MEKTAFEIESADNRKKASLLLFSLNEIDRQWMFDHLPSEQTNRLKGHIAELIDIGLQPDNAVIQDLLRQSNATEVAQESFNSSELTKKSDSVDQLSSEEISTLLAGEPEAVVALILSVKNWRWAPNYLAGLPVQTREQVRSLIDNYLGAIAAPVKESIVHHLYQRSLSQLGKA